MKFVRLLLSCSLLLGACGGEADGTSESSSGPTSFDIDAGSECSSLANVGDDVTLMMVPASAPAPRGGTIANGVYTLTAYTQYTGSGGDAGPASKHARMTIRILGSRMESNFDDGPRAGTLATSGTTLTSQVTCPSGAPQTMGFAATPAELLVFDDDNPSRVMTFTKK